MRIAFAIVSLFPGGGLQRDCINIAHRVRKLGHEVTIFTARKSGDGFVADLSVRILDVPSRTNHQRQRAFSDELKRVAVGKFDVIVGFDKLDGLDILYCSDASMRARVTRNPLLRLLPRYREYVHLEKTCFAPQLTNKIMLLSEPQLNEYWTSWTTEQRRLTVLPPTLEAARSCPQYRIDGTREKYRQSVGLSTEVWAWIAICVQPKTKGLDRTIQALSHFPEARLLIVGLQKREEKCSKFRDVANRYGVANRIAWLGHREDVPELMAAADIFVHPARYDTTGTVILEAIVNGLPVITTSTCGYAKHVSIANAGVVLQEPFRQKVFLRALNNARNPVRAMHWSKSGSEYGKQSSLFEGRSHAAELIVASAIGRTHAAIETKYDIL